MKNGMENKENTLFDSSVDFSQYVENQAYANRSTVLETLLKIIDEYDFDIEKIKPMISNSLRDKLKVEFMEKGMIKRESSLLDFFE